MKTDSRPAALMLDVEGTLARFGGDRQLFQEIIGFFLEDTPPLLDELRRAVSVGNEHMVRSAAHSLKGLAAGCGGVRTAQAAQRVENAGAEGDLENIDSLMDTLESEYDQLRQAASNHQF